MITTTVTVILIVLMLLYFGYEHQMLDKSKHIDTFVRMPLCYNMGAFDYHYPLNCQQFKVGPHMGKNNDYL